MFHHTHIHQSLFWASWIPSRLSYHISLGQFPLRPFCLQTSQIFFLSDFYTKFLSVSHLRHKCYRSCRYRIFLFKDCQHIFSRIIFTEKHIIELSAFFSNSSVFVLRPYTSAAMDCYNALCSFWRHCSYTPLNNKIL
jgi:hypothetical protein